MKMLDRSRHFAPRLLFSALLCFALTGCLLIPGQFKSSLDIRRDGQFTYSYVGTIIFTAGDLNEDSEAVWDDSMADCRHEESWETIPCSAEEIARQRREFEYNQRKGLEAAANFATLIGYNPVEPEANEQIAKELMRHPGWKKVTYLGNSTFDVEYELSGRLDRDFSFPILPQAHLAMPFINLSRDRDGVIAMSAGGLASQPMRQMIFGEQGAKTNFGSLSNEERALLLRTRGDFTITTDAKVLSTNGTRTAATDAEQISWRIDAETVETPQFRVQLD
ncbi:hypothetical protein G6N82_10630 [Altererythrobacter sp. BO-6]|uniref:hypothetical protein n=1 Tax=Altererythrobacter sp. BO-6 TaxID=2604537 RepID=UPI0013E18F8A|nr:hypothetical protein [Altererythrobacter sp. BO-6]QIG54548.1 hypothetical protein G6N82_10630 [Altererythrobacter sp. BO-6]